MRILNLRCILDFTFAFTLLPYSLFEEVLWSLAVVSKQRKEVPGHVKLQLCCTTLIEMVVQYELWE